jgi:hypothetical protein
MDRYQPILVHNVGILIKMPEQTPPDVQYLVIHRDVPQSPPLYILLVDIPASSLLQAMLHDLGRSSYQSST